MKTADPPEQMFLQVYRFVNLPSPSLSTKRVKGLLRDFENSASQPADSAMEMAE